MTVLPPVGSSTTGITLAQYRRSLADEVGRLAILMTTSTPSIATTPDALRQILASEMQADGQLPDSLDGCWVYVVDGAQAGAVRRILSGTYDSGDASILVDRPFAAALASGTEIEITDTLPAKRYGLTIGFREVINTALETLPVPDRVDIDIVANQLRYSLAGYAWPIKGLGGVYEPRASSDDPLIPTYQSVGLSFDADEPQLVLGSGFSTGTADEFTVELLRPATTWIRVGGSWIDSTTGLVNESDAALYDVKTVVVKAIPTAKERIARLYPLGSAERSELLGEAENDHTRGALARWYGRFGAGARVQRVGATGGRRGSWWRNL